MLCLSCDVLVRRVSSADRSSRDPRTSSAGGNASASASLLSPGAAPGKEVPFEEFVLDKWSSGGDDAARPPSPLGQGPGDAHTQPLESTDGYDSSTFGSVDGDREQQQDGSHAKQGDDGGGSDAEAKMAVSYSEFAKDNQSSKLDEHEPAGVSVSAPITWAHTAVVARMLASQCANLPCRGVALPLSGCCGGTWWRRLSDGSLTVRPPPTHTSTVRMLCLAGSTHSTRQGCWMATVSTSQVLSTPTRRVHRLRTRPPAMSILAFRPTKQNLAGFRMAHRQVVATKRLAVVAQRPRGPHNPSPPVGPSPHRPRPVSCTARGCERSLPRGRPDPRLRRRIGTATWSDCRRMLRYVTEYSLGGGVFDGAE